MPIPHNTEESISFLRRWTRSAANTPWVLTAIFPDGEISTTSFLPTDWAACANWIDAAVKAGRNVYFHVNPVRRALVSKATKEDIARLGWLHVDIDPRPGEDFQEERDLALKTLTEFVPRPTVIVDSGGGYQGFWRLAESPELEINGDLAQAELLELYNIQLEKIFHADHCHNVDRIMRLPGTLNYPNRKKLAKGRHVVLAKLVEFAEDREYSIREFRPAVRVQADLGRNTGGVLSATKTKLKLTTGNVPDVGVDDLVAWANKSGHPIKDSTLALIATGQDPVDPNKYGSRSEVLFRVVCDLIRAEVPDEMIYATITGSNEIANSVKDKKNWETYAIRQIERGHEEAIAPELRELNEKHAVISDVGGKCRIISEVEDPTVPGRTRISFQSFEDFRNRYRNRKVVIGFNAKAKSEVTIPLGAWWIDHEKRRQYSTIVFSPGQDTTDSYNLWSGFACDAIPGTLHDRFLEHIRLNLCGNDDRLFDYLIRWMARAVQHPNTQGEVAVVLKGARGTGKGMFGRALRGIFGRHFLQVSDAKHLVGQFNSHLRDTVFLFADEAFFAGDKRHESVLKTMVTEDTLVVEGKGRDVEVTPNYLHIMMASNEDWVVPAGFDERRFLVLSVGEAHKQDHGYFKQIQDDLEAGGYSSLLYYLMTLDLHDYNVRRVPRTAALQEQIMFSMSPESAWWYDKLVDGVTFGGRWMNEVLKSSLYSNYLNNLKDQGIQRRLSPAAFTRKLKDMVPELKMVRKMADVPIHNEHGFEVTRKELSAVYLIPTLETCRGFWTRIRNDGTEWASNDSQTVMGTDDDDGRDPF